MVQVPHRRSTHPTHKVDPPPRSLDVMDSSYGGGHTGGGMGGWLVAWLPDVHGSAL